MSAEELQSIPKAATLIVRPPREGPPAKVGGLVGLFRLLKFGNSLLFPSTLIELGVMAWILLIVGVFELVVWTSFFNVVLNRDVAYWGPKLLVAAAAAIPFALVVLFFERGMLMLDSENRWRFALAALLRFGMILATVVYVTSLSFELWFFRPTILDRAGQEAIRARVVAVWTKVESLRLDAQDIRENKAIRQHLEEILSERKAALGKLVRSAKIVVQTDVGLEELRNSSISEAGDEVAQDFADLKKARAAREVDRQTAAGEVKRINERVRALEEQRRAEEEADHKRREESAKLALALESKLQTCIGELFTTESERICQLEGFHADPKDPDFLVQKRILRDLAAGRPPLWRGISEGERARMVPALGFPDLRCDSADTKSDGCRQLEAERDSYQENHWLSQILGALIPMLMVLIKSCLLPDEVRRYYSRRHQAEAGNSGARQLALVEAGVREKEKRND